MTHLCTYSNDIRLSKVYHDEYISDSNAHIRTFDFEFTTEFKGVS